MDAVLEKEIIDIVKKQMSALTDDGMPIGSIMPFPMEKAPVGWLACDGRLYAKEQFPALFDAIEYRFGESQGLFRVPDLQGQFVRGLDLKGNIDPGRTLGSLQDDALLGHRHGISQASETDSAGEHYHGINYDYTGTPGFFSGDYKRVYKIDRDASSLQGFTKSSGAHSHPIPRATVLDVTSSSYGDVSGRVGNETRPKNVALLYCIKAEHIQGIRDFVQAEYGTLLNRLSSDMVEKSISAEESIPVMPVASAGYQDAIERIKGQFFKTVPDKRTELLWRTGRCFEAICLYNARAGASSKGFDDTGLHLLVSWMADKGIIKHQERETFKEDIKAFFRSARPDWSR